MQNAKTIARVERERERESLCLLENKSLKSLGLICIVEKLYILYRNIKEDMQLLHRQTVF